jgi:hypothetical protein|tara:strand:- start:169 stop:324 length:156 start_codon:yes stop_codon:yes gene_type:complete
MYILKALFLGGLREGSGLRAALAAAFLLALNFVVVFVFSTRLQVGGLKLRE